MSYKLIIITGLYTSRVTLPKHLSLALHPALGALLPEQALGVVVDDAPVQVIATQARRAAAQAPPPVTILSWRLSVGQSHICLHECTMSPSQSDQVP